MTASRLVTPAARGHPRRAPTSLRRLRVGLRRRISSTSSRSPKRTTAASRTPGPGTSRPTWTNLTIADPRVNRTEKSDRDAGEWTPGPARVVCRARHRRQALKYELSVDPRERDVLEALLADGGAQLSCVDADTTSPPSGGHQQRPPAPRSPAPSPSRSPSSGFELEDLVVGNGSASELQGNNASYMATITPRGLGHRDGGHRGRGRAGRGRQPERQPERDGRCSSRSSRTPRRCRL